MGNRDASCSMESWTAGGGIIDQAMEFAPHIPQGISMLCEERLSPWGYYVQQREGLQSWAK